MLRRINTRVILSIIMQLVFWAPAMAEPASSWSQLVEKLQKRINAGSLGNDVSISFQNAPFKKYMEDELMAYTFRSDGEVIVQMNDQVKTIRVAENELLWLARFLTEHKLKDFPEKEPRLADSASFAIILKVGNSRKGIWLYNKANDKFREVAWQYMFHLGQTLLEDAGLRDKNEAIIPVCEGINRLEELDSNNDGVIDWLRLKIGFYAFRAGQYTFDFSGIRHSVFLTQGKSEKDFFLNTYLLHPEAGFNQDYLSFIVDSQPPNPVGPFRMDLGLKSGNHLKKNFRSSPDLVFSGPENNRFSLRLRQSAIVEVDRSPEEHSRKILRFTLTELVPEGARLTGKDDPVLLTKDEKITLAEFGCLSSLFRLSGVDPGNATFEVSWNIPEPEGVRKKIEYFNEVLARDDYAGDKETAKSSLDFCQECLELLDGLEELEIKVIYTSPPEAT